jgi:hypothetical protein
MVVLVGLLQTRDNHSTNWFGEGYFALTTDQPMLAVLPVLSGQADI